LHFAQAGLDHGPPYFAFLTIARMIGTCQCTQIPATRSCCHEVSRTFCLGWPWTAILCLSATPSPPTEKLGLQIWATSAMSLFLKDDFPLE
jgi:hypothetical protein